MIGPNVRIARAIRLNGAVIKTDLLGSWFVSPEEFQASAKWNYIVRSLAEVQAEEPELGWKMECRGDSSYWHEWQS